MFSLDPPARRDESSISMKPLTAQLEAAPVSQEMLEQVEADKRERENSSKMKRQRGGHATATPIASKEVRGALGVASVSCLRAMVAQATKGAAAAPAPAPAASDASPSFGAPVSVPLACWASSRLTMATAQTSTFGFGTPASDFPLFGAKRTADAAKSPEPAPAPAPASFGFSFGGDAAAVTTATSNPFSAFGAPAPSFGDTGAKEKDALDIKKAEKAAAAEAERAAREQEERERANKEREQEQARERQRQKEREEKERKEREEQERKKKEAAAAAAAPKADDKLAKLFDANGNCRVCENNKDDMDHTACLEDEADGDGLPNADESYSAPPLFGATSAPSSAPFSVSMGTPASSVDTGFKFGDSAPAAPSFSFGAAAALPKFGEPALPKFGEPTLPKFGEATLPKFGEPAEKPKEPAPLFGDSAPFTFGGTGDADKKASAAPAPSAGGFSFGAPAERPATPPRAEAPAPSAAPVFSFGGTDSSKPAAGTSAPFVFGAPEPASAPTPAAAAPTPGVSAPFTFGDVSAPAPSLSVPAFGSTSSAPFGAGGGFGAQPATPAPAASPFGASAFGAPTTAAPAATPSFAFGASGAQCVCDAACALTAKLARSSGSGLFRAVCLRRRRRRRRRR